MRPDEKINHQAIVKLMVGRDLSQFYQRNSTEHGEVVLELVNLRTPAHPNCELTFNVRRGEIVGISGLVGAGRTELLQTIFGVTPAIGGLLKLNGAEVRPQRPVSAIDSGIALAPEDRKQHGLVLPMSVRENASLPRLRVDQKLGAINFQSEMDVARDTVEKMNVKTPHLEQV